MNSEDTTKTAMFSYFRGPILNTTPENDPVTLTQVHTWITSDRFKSIIEKLRSRPTKEERDNIKITLPSVTFSGIFTRRKNEYLKTHSGYIVIDLDNIPNIESNIESILLSTAPALLFLSPSGQGVKVVYAIDIESGDHLKYWLAFQSMYRRELSIEIDKSGKDISRACFLSYDPKAVLNKEPALYGRSFIDYYLSDKDVGDLMSSDRYSKIKAWVDERERFEEGNRNNYITTLAGACHRCGLAQDETLRELRAFEQPGFPLREIEASVRSIYSNHVYEGTQNDADEINKRTTQKRSLKVIHDPIPQFPIDGLPSELQELIRVCYNVYKTPIDFWGAAILAATGSAMGNSFKLKGKYNNTSALWWSIISTSGTGKSEPIDFAFSPFRTIDKNNLETYKVKKSSFEAIATLSKKERELQNLEIGDCPVYVQNILNDFTPEAMAEVHNNNLHGIILYRDELMGLINDLGRYQKSGELETYLTLWSGKGVVVNRKCQDPLRIDDPCVTIIGGIQTSKIFDLAKDGRADNGMIPRFLFVWPDICKRQEYSKETLPESLIGWYQTYINTLMSFQSEIAINLSEQAEQLYIKYFNNNVKAINAESEELMIQMYAKLDIIVLRLALAVHGSKIACSGKLSGHISEETMDCAIKLAEYFKKTAMKVSKYLNPNASINITKRDVIEFFRDVMHESNQSKVSHILKVSHQYVNKIYSEKDRLQVAEVYNIEII